MGLVELRGQRWAAARSSTPQFFCKSTGFECMYLCRQSSVFDDIWCVRKTIPRRVQHIQSRFIWCIDGAVRAFRRRQFAASGLIRRSLSARWDWGMTWRVCRQVAGGNFFFPSPWIGLGLLFLCLEFAGDLVA